MSFTAKQVSIVQIVIKGNGTDPATKKFSPVDLDQLIERLDYNPTKQSIQFSIRALVRHGLITKGDREHRRGRSRVTILPTAFARQVTGYAVNPGMVTPHPGSSPPMPSLSGDLDSLPGGLEDPFLRAGVSSDEVIEEL